MVEVGRYSISKVQPLISKMRNKSYVQSVLFMTSVAVMCMLCKHTSEALFGYADVLLRVEKDCIALQGLKRAGAHSSCAMKEKQ